MTSICCCVLGVLSRWECRGRCIFIRSTFMSLFRAILRSRERVSRVAWEEWQRWSLNEGRLMILVRKRR